MEFFTPPHILLAAFILDLILGDSKFLPHPVRWMGKAITSLEPYFRNFCIKLTVSGTFFAIFLILCAWLITFILVKVAQMAHPLLRTCVEITVIYYCISMRSLKQAVMDVHISLKQNNLQDAKKKVSMIVGRDVENLDQTKIIQAAIESAAENFVDGVMSPLFFAAVGGAPCAIAYKMINTLDSMIGYKNEKYISFGKTAAKIDDAANFIPARLSIPIISLAAQILERKGIGAFTTAISEGSNHSSPNAGYSEAAFAGAMEIKLGGPNKYQGRLVSKSYIGAKFKNPNVSHIKKACNLMLLSSVLWLCVVLAIGI